MGLLAGEPHALGHKPVDAAPGSASDDLARFVVLGPVLAAPVRGLPKRIDQGRRRDLPRRTLGQAAAPLIERGLTRPGLLSRDVEQGRLRPFLHVDRAAARPLREIAADLLVEGTALSEQLVKLLRVLEHLALARHRGLPGRDPVTCWIAVSGAGARYRDDGTDPTATVGQPLSDGDTFEYDGTLSAFKIIQTGPTAVLDVTFYG